MTEACVRVPARKKVSDSFTIYSSSFSKIGSCNIIVNRSPLSAFFWIFLKHFSLISDQFKNKIAQLVLIEGKLSIIFCEIIGIKFFKQKKVRLEPSCKCLFSESVHSFTNISHFLITTISLNNF